MKGVERQNLELSKVCIRWNMMQNAFDAVYALSSTSILTHVSSILQWTWILGHC